MSERIRRHSGLQYRLVSRLIHQPRLLRAMAALLKRKPSLARLARVVSSYRAVAAVFRREASFSNTAHASNLRGGEFVIGMDSGPRQQAERAFLERALPTAESFRNVSIEAARRGIERVQQAATGKFDLIEYMVGIAWRSLARTFVPVDQAIAGADPTDPELPSPEFVADLRTLGAHLIIGAIAPARISALADARAADLNARVSSERSALRTAWAAHQPGDATAVQRNAVGLMWVGHPATVQAGALLMQELLGRRAVLRSLEAQAAALQNRVWSDAAFRVELKNHVLELLRFRPPFPILHRDVARDTWFDVGDKVPAGHAAAGAQLTLLTIGAMFDNDAMDGDDAALFKPGRKFRQDADRYMMFGMGGRSCIASHQVTEMLVSALAGLLTLRDLDWGGSTLRRMVYEGPIIRSMPLRFRH